MADSDTNNKELIVAPQNAFDKRRKTLDDRLKEISLDEPSKEKIARDAGQKLIRDNLLGLFKVGELVRAVLTWNESIEKEFKSAKKDALIEVYFEKCDNSETAIKNLTRFITDPQGNTLFNKILRILDDSPPDLELTAHLAAALKHIAESKFSDLFQKHKYILSQIELVTPQSLTIMADNASWPQMHLQSYSSQGRKVSSDWLNPFANLYAASKNITDIGMIRRLRHSIGELTDKRFIEAHLTGASGQSSAKCVLTEMGSDFLPYLSAPER
jgi:hypothetical protein